MPQARTPFVFTLALFVTLAARAAEPLPSADDLQALADKKDWPALLSAVSRVLPLKGPAVADYDRVDLWTKKGEAQLQGKQFTPAAQSFARAADEPKATPEQSDTAKALSELAKKSDAKGYKTPAKQGGRTFEIFDPAKRPEAFAAMLAADVAELKQRVETAKAALDVKPILELSKSAADLRPLDRVVNKSTDQADAIEKTLAGHFADVVTKWSTATQKRLDELKTDADEMVQQRITDRYGRTVIRQVRKGVNSNELTEVRKLTQQSEQMAGTYTTVEKAMAAPGKEVIKPLQDAIQSTYDKAKALQADAARPQNNSTR